MGCGSRNGCHKAFIKFDGESLFDFVSWIECIVSYYFHIVKPGKTGIWRLNRNLKGWWIEACDKAEVVRRAIWLVKLINDCQLWIPSNTFIVTESRQRHNHWSTCERVYNHRNGYCQDLNPSDINIEVLIVVTARAERRARKDWDEIQYFVGLISWSSCCWEIHDVRTCVEI